MTTRIGPPHSAPLAAVGISVVLWSTAYVGGAFALDAASPAVVAIGRFGCALAVLIPLALHRGGVGMRGALVREILRPRSILLGLTGTTAYHVLSNIGLDLTTAGAAALASAALPVFTAIAAAVVLRERIRPAVAIGLAAATLGVGIVASAGFRLDLGLVLCVLSLVSYAWYTVQLRRDALRGIVVDPIVLGTATTVWGTALMLPWLATEAASGGMRMPTDVGGIAAIAFLGLVVTAPSTVLFTYGAERLPAAVSGIATAVIPVLAYGLAIALGEPLDAVRLVGGALAVGGVLLAIRAETRRASAPAGSAELAASAVAARRFGRTRVDLHPRAAGDADSELRTTRRGTRVLRRRAARGSESVPARQETVAAQTESQPTAR